MEEAMNQEKKQVIALKFDTLSEPEYLLSIIEDHLKLTQDKGRPKEADELLKALKDCIKMFKEKSKPQGKIVDDAGVDIKTGKYVGDATAWQKEPADPKKEYMEKIHGKQKDK